MKDLNIKSKPNKLLENTQIFGQKNFFMSLEALVNQKKKRHVEIHQTENILHCKGNYQ